MSKPLAEL